MGDAGPCVCPAHGRANDGKSDGVSLGSAHCSTDFFTDRCADRVAVIRAVSSTHFRPNWHPHSGPICNADVQSHGVSVCSTLGRPLGRPLLVTDCSSDGRANRGPICCSNGRADGSPKRGAICVSKRFTYWCTERFAFGHTHSQPHRSAYGCTHGCTHSVPIVFANAAVLCRGGSCWLRCLGHATRLLARDEPTGRGGLPTDQQHECKCCARRLALFALRTGSCGLPADVPSSVRDIVSIRRAAKESVYCRLHSVLLGFANGVAISHSNNRSVRGSDDTSHRLANDFQSHRLADYSANGGAYIATHNLTHARMS